MTSPYTLPERQRLALMAQPDPERFKHFVGRVADEECLWGLRDAKGWVTLADSSGAEGFPVWPHPDYAIACAVDAWAGNVAAKIDVYEFTEEWLPDMAAREVTVAVFLMPEMKGVWISPEELQGYLADELAQYE